jgi:hypothetical protein
MVWYHVECTDETDTNGVWNCAACRTLPSLVHTLVDSLSQLRVENAALRNDLQTLHKTEHSTALIEKQTKTLMDEISSLRTEVASLRALLDAAQRDHVDNLSGHQVRTPSFSDVVKASVQFALREECVKNDLVLNLPDNKRDIDDMNDLCQKARVAVKPSSVTRIGKPGGNRLRPMKASFPTPFDARAFMAKLEAYKKELKDARTGDTLTKVRCRPCRTREEQARYSAVAKEVHQLNTAAKARGNEPTESYSLRHNGEVWKFVKQDDGWKRITDWVFVPRTPENDSTPENDARSPRKNSA